MSVPVNANRDTWPWNCRPLWARSKDGRRIYVFDGAAREWFELTLGLSS